MAARRTTANSRPGNKPWDRPRPRKAADRVHLTEAEKDRARSRAKAAGRPYPNLVDNMQAAKEHKRAAKNSKRK